MKKKKNGQRSFDTLLDTIFTRLLKMSSRVESRGARGESRSERVKRNRSRDTRVVPREFSRGPRGELSSLWMAVQKGTSCPGK